jgi:hypothetical protein
MGSNHAFMRFCRKTTMASVVLEGPFLRVDVLSSTSPVAGSCRLSRGSELGRAAQVIVGSDDAGNLWVGGAISALFRGTAMA